MEGQINNLVSSLLATIGAVEHHPGLEVVAEIDEAVLNSSGDEKDIAGLEGMTLVAIDKLAVTRNDDIQLILSVRRLPIITLGSIELQGQGTSLEQRYKAQLLLGLHGKREGVK